jgi:hypothetical protein
MSVYLGDRINLKIGDMAFKLIREDGRTVIKLVGGDPRNVSRYRELLMQKFGGSISDWNNRVYQNLITKGIALYEHDISRAHLNNKSSYRNTMKRWKKCC